MLMLVRDSNKHQPEFDLAEARRIYSVGGWDKKIGGEDITSPHHLFSVETLRDRLDLRLGNAIPTDVFVFGKGEPPRPDCTHIGGNPFWPSSRNWPTDGQGKPFRFFAQINFADSKDLVGDLPGDLLLLFVGERSDWYWEPMDVHFEWVSLGSQVRTNFDRSLIATTSGPFFGAIFRTADYPDAIRLAREPDEGQYYGLPILYGTKIGGVPRFNRSGRDVPGQFLCQIGSIQAQPKAPFPWVNRPEPLDLWSEHNSIHTKGNDMCFGDMEYIYIYREGDGRVRSGFDCT
jgi:Domain of unknown function (DUF1963)